MYGWLKISHHRHSGRHRPHEHTSYPALVLLVLVVGLVLGACTTSTVAGESPGPAASSVSLSGTVPKKAPTAAPTITSPTKQQRFTTSPITIAGTCTPDTIVEIFKNEIFAGSAPCDNNGRFSFNIDLLIGQNTLVARVYDVLNQAGPDSAPVIVFYDASLPPGASLSLLNFSGSQMLLNTDAVYRGVFPGQQLNVPVNIIGGSPPFAVNVQWGDSGNSVIARNDNSTFNASHTYRKAGTYQIMIQASDSQGRVAFLTVAAIINGQPGVVPVASTTKPTLANKLLVLWPLYAILVTVVISFWLGERREKRLLSVNGPVYHAT